MKKRYAVLLGTLCFVSVLTTNAQDVSSAYKTEAMTATRQLAAFISLDDARQLPVRRLTQQRLAQEAEVRHQYANDADMQRKKLAAIGQEYTAQLQQILSPAQFQRYVAAGPEALPASVAAVLPPPSPEPVMAQAPATTGAVRARPKPAATPARRPTVVPPVKAAVRR